ncbi:MAG: ABC transporter ATP-binding protein [Nitrospinota bacterium]
MAEALRMERICKRFPGVLANDHIDLSVSAGEIHALLGENGAGKTTLMNILYGLYQPDEGELFYEGKKVALRSPSDAINLGIGMVHQHFMLIPRHTVVENVIMGTKSSRGLILKFSRAEQKILEMSHRLGLQADPRARVWQLSVGQQQRVEIIKALYRGARLLVLDEPTSVLVPQEVEELFSVLRSLAAQGHAVIFITHKLNEVMEVSDRVTVLRDGRNVATLPTRETDERSLARLMVGREVLFRVKRDAVEVGRPVLKVQGIKVMDAKGLPAVRDISFTVRAGEVLGVAGVDGNGQMELAEALTGLRKAAAGRVFLGEEEITNVPSRGIIRKGLAHIPADRRNRGLVPNHSLVENSILESYGQAPFSKAGFLRPREMEAYAARLVEEYDVRTPSLRLPVRILSGGNQQKVILARALARKPRVLVAMQPTRGLDVGATEYIHNEILAQRRRGTAVLLISTELNEVLSLSDRIAVLFEGRIVGELHRDEAEVHELGLMMTGARGKVSA